ARDGGHRQQEQQDEGGAHAGELAPSVAQGGHESIGADHTLTSPTPTVARSQVTKSPQAPVNSARPTMIRSAAPIQVTQRECRRITVTAPITRRNPSPNRRKGSPRPTVYAAASTAARPLCPPTV